MSGMYRGGSVEEKGEGTVEMNVIYGRRVGKRLVAETSCSLMAKWGHVFNVIWLVLIMPRCLVNGWMWYIVVALCCAC